MEVRKERQNNPVADPVQALTAVCRPIIASVLASLSEEAVRPTGGRDNVPLHLLGRLRKEGDGDCGIAFEFAVHEAIRNQEPVVTERVQDALRECRIKTGDPASIFFAVEKQARSKQLIATELDLVTDESRVLSGKVGQPPKLKWHLSNLAAAFYRPRTRLNLPQSINGLWRADLFLGTVDSDRWVGTSVKNNPRDVRADNGLRIAIVPAHPDRSDAVRLQDRIVICPLPHDGSYMEVFYKGLEVVQALCATDFQMPKPVELPDANARHVARLFVDRREFPVVDVLEATEKFSQPELLIPHEEQVGVVTLAGSNQPETSTMISPFPRLT